ncbi:protein containg PAS domain S-box [Longilinea arvoryzae]|uniref:histidine kinase n=1 Tax=Longilinea arvoryzae TaxID=360412 RepID=A0A0S7BCY4_9CHLR|nr:ATP-binding protein [Longilinea arvoryzae]GAP12564.1 protein containg PAS domain S-box [Longilinea arvoryzae]
MTAQDRTRSSLELLLDISRELATTLDMHTVLARVLDLSVANIGAERGSLIILDANQEPVDAAIVVGGRMLPHTVEQLKGTLSHGLAGWVMRNRTAVLVPDTSQDERWMRREDDSAERTGAKSAMCLPLTARESIVGVLTIVHPEPGVFTDEQLALLRAISDIAGMAVHNAQLYTSLENAHRRYRELFEDSIDPIFVTTLSGQILEANRQAANVTGYSLEDLPKQAVQDLHAVRWDRVGAGFERLAGSLTVRYESELRVRNGAKLPVDVYARRVEIEGAPCLQWILRDISERKDLDALREDLSAMIYHDLRSPLANMISSLDILASLLPLDENDTLKSVFQIATRSTERMQRLISSLLDIHRLEAGQSIANRTEVSIASLVGDALDSVVPMVDTKHLSVTQELAPDLPPAFVDSDMIRRVVTNLLDNASKFTPMNGVLRITACRKGEWIEVGVSDSGPGIPPEAHEAIFNKFTRLHTERMPKGLGLGLAFCRLAVQSHGGKIWVEDEPGHGSRFLFTLPVAKTA